MPHHKGAEHQYYPDFRNSLFMPDLDQPNSAQLPVAVLGFSFWGPLGWRHFHLGGGAHN